MAERNRRHLEWQYLQSTGAAKALELMRSQPSDYELGHLLRDHRDEPIEAMAEVRRRDEFDDLLTYYALLELASATRFAPSTLPDEVREEALQVLRHPAVASYYQDYYPLLLVDLFRERLEGNPVLPSNFPESANALFPALLDISAPLTSGEDLDVFLWFLDDGIWGGYALSDLVELVGDPDRYVEHLNRLAVDGSSNALDRSLIGLQEFLGFSLAFDALLQRCGDSPLLQSAFWHFHGYWFDQIGTKVREGLDSILDQFAAWTAAETASDTGESEREEAVTSILEVKSAIERLTDGGYGQNLRGYARGEVLWA